MSGRLTKSPQPVLSRRKAEIRVTPDTEATLFKARLATETKLDLADLARPYGLVRKDKLVPHQALAMSLP